MCGDLSGDVIHTASQNRACLRVTSIILALLSAVATLALAFTYTKDYAETSHLVAASCKVTGYSLSGQNLVISCQCEGDTRTGDDACYSYYPCLHITAKYLSTAQGDNTPKVQQVTLHDNNYHMLRSLRQVRTECFVAPCNSNYAYNKDAVFDAEALYAYYGKTLDCYYDPSDPARAVVNRTPEGLAYVVVILPGACFVIGIFLLVFSFCFVD